MTRSIKLYYYNTKKDKNLLLLSDAVVPVTRTIKVKSNLIKETIELLIKAELTKVEKEKGFSTEFPHPDFKLLDCELKNGVLTLVFSVVIGFTNGGSSRVILLATQIEKTALQFNEVKEIVYKPEILFQP